MSGRHRNWTWTINNPRSRDWQHVYAMPYKHFVFTIEMGGNTDTVHFQGCSHMKKDYTLSRMKDFLPRAHFKVAYNYAGAITYATKLDDTFLDGPYEMGTPPAQGKRMANDLMELIKDGTPRSEVADSFPQQFLQLQRGIEAAYTVFAPPRQMQSKVTYVYGASGTGKTTWARTFPNVYSPPPPKNGSYWFNGYDSIYHDTVLFDEFWGDVPLSVMNRYLHEHPELVETKGGMTQFAPKYIVITSNLAPEDLYKRMFSEYPEAKATWLRRLHNIVHFGEIDYKLIKGSLLFPTTKSPAPPALFVQPAIFMETEQRHLNELAISYRAKHNHQWRDPFAALNPVVPLPRWPVSQ